MTIDEGIRVDNEKRKKIRRTQSGGRDGMSHLVQGKRGIRRSAGGGRVIRYFRKSCEQ